MIGDDTGTAGSAGVEQARPAAPSARAKALREEMLGGALTLDEAAFILNLDRTTVAKYLREHTLAGFQIGREWLVPEEVLRQYVRRQIEIGSPSGASAPRGLIERVRSDLSHLGKRRDRGAMPEHGGEVSQRFDRFTDRARKVLTMAQEEAQSFQHNYIGTEHLLLGLLREREGVAARVIGNLGLELENARHAIEQIIGRGERPVTGQISLTPRAKKVIELAVDEARKLEHHFIGTEHLLLGLIREGNGIAAGFLETLGVELEQAREETLRVLGEKGAALPGAEPAQRPTVPAEADALIGADEAGFRCGGCGARGPLYFHFCFNCGAILDLPSKG